MRILLIGDVVGKPGRVIVTQALPGLVVREKLDLVIVNGENSAGGSGITPPIYRELLAAGADCITLGDHIYRKREIIPVLESATNIVKPANYPATAPGREFAVVTARNGALVGVVSVMGRVFMREVDCPFTALDRVLAQLPADVRIVVVDVHAEATSDKQLIGRFLDGRVSAVLGTHTHVPTADEEVLPGGTAFQCDVGMTGPYESIIGRRIDRVMETARTFNPTHFEVPLGDPRLSGTIVDVDAATGHAVAVRRICIRQAEATELAELVRADAPQQA